MFNKKWYDITWITRKGCRHNQYGNLWHIIAIAHSKKEARQMFDEWWYSDHDYHAFHIEITADGSHGSYVLASPIWMPIKHIDKVLESED